MDTRAQLSFSEFASHSDWFRKSYQAREFPWHVQVWGIQKMMQLFPWAQQMGGTITESSGMQHWLWCISEMTRVRGEFLQRVLADSAFLDSFERDFFAAWSAFEKAEVEYVQKYPMLSADGRISALYDLCEVESTVGAYGYMNDIFLTAGGDDWLLEWFDRELPKDTPDRESVIAMLCVPVQMSFVQQQHLELMQIGLLPESERLAALEAHHTAWHWVENSYIESVPLSAETFGVKLQAMIKKGEVTQDRVTELQESEQNTQAKKQALFAEYNVSQMLQTIIDCSDRISHLTDMRKKGVLRLNGHIWKCFTDVAAEAGVSFETLVWMIPAEMRDVFTSRDFSRVEERKRTGAITMIHHGEFCLVQGADFTALDLTSFFGDTTGKTSLKGQVAFAGVVTGKARIIRGRNDFNQFIDGDILITNQTTPEFIPLMKRASAVVTEQGGITCHAAIVSRELKVPCIIGCTSAMSFFKNGEIVVVDGTKGEVRHG